MACSGGLTAGPRQAPEEYLHLPAVSSGPFFMRCAAAKDFEQHHVFQRASFSLESTLLAGPPARDSGRRTWGGLEKGELREVPRNRIIRVGNETSPQTGK